MISGVSFFSHLEQIFVVTLKCIFNHIIPFIIIIISSIISSSSSSSSSSIIIIIFDLRKIQQNIMVQFSSLRSSNSLQVPMITKE